MENGYAVAKVASRSLQNIRWKGDFLALACGKLPNSLIMGGRHRWASERAQQRSRQNS